MVILVFFPLSLNCDRDRRDRDISICSLTAGAFMAGATGTCLCNDQAENIIFSVLCILICYRLNSRIIFIITIVFTHWNNIAINKPSSIVFITRCICASSRISCL